MTADLLSALDANNVECSHLFFGRDFADLVDRLKQETNESGVSAVILDGLDELQPDKRRATLEAANFKRDVIFTLGISMLIWANSVTVRELALWAPDLWSRRTSTHYLSRVNVHGALARIFGEKSATSTPSQSESRIGAALQVIVSNEQSLNVLLGAGEPSSSEAVGESLSGISRSVELLLDYCGRREVFYVVLTLWNLSRADEIINRSFYRAMSRIPQSLGLAYDHRGDVIFDMADRLGPILANYRHDLDERVKFRKPINLLGYFATFVKFRARNAAAEANKLRSRIHLGDLADELRDPVSFEDRVKAEAADRLLRWIEDGTGAMPPLFSESDGKVLRALHDVGGDTKAAAKKLGLSLQEGTEWFNALESKVRAFLEMV